MVIIEDAQLLTPEAQNALLKVLEEPPANTYIIMGTDTKDSLLPTILSRCQIIHAGRREQKNSGKNTKEINTFIQEFPDFSIGKRLKYAERLAKDKEKAIIWIQDLILILREAMLNKYAGEYMLIRTHTTSSESIQYGNSNRYSLSLKQQILIPRFAIEQTLLSL